MWQVEKPEIFQCRNGGKKTWVALIPVRAGESLNVGKCDTVWAGYNAFVEYADHYSEVRGPGISFQGQGPKAHDCGAVTTVRGDTKSRPSWA